MNAKEFALKQHEEWNGKIEVISRAKLETPEDLAVAYTPGVAEPCLKIAEDVDLSYKYTRRHNMVAVVTDGSAVLGLGDIGPEAGMPVMEGKCVLFKEFGDVDAFPLCIRSNDVDEIVNTVRLLAGSFGGVNLEDISAPRCFEIERKLKECCDIPIFHDDQHGTAVVTAAAMLNALKLTGRKLEDIKVVTSGAGAAGIAIIKLLVSLGLKTVIMCDRKGAAVVGTGRSDFPNQINNVLAFPGIFRGALDVRAKDINDEMKVAAAYAIAGLIDEKELNADYIIPNPFDKRVAKAVAEAVAKAARDTGVSRI